MKITKRHSAPRGDKKFHGFVAISPEGVGYTSYDSIPTIPSPSVLIVRDWTITVDGWVIQVALRRSFLEFITRLCKGWNDHTVDARRQLCGFLEALESKIQNYA